MRTGAVPGASYISDDITFFDLISYTQIWVKFRLVHIFCDKSLSIMIDLGIISGTA
jgi:hypothetical protein